MGWSNFYEFNKENIEQQVSKEKAGIYRIALLDENSGFKISSKIEKKEKIKYWEGLFSEFDIPELAQKRILQTRLLTGKYRSDIYTNLVYIGRSDNMRERLLQHFSNSQSKGNSGVLKLLKYHIPLRFSYLSKGDSTKSERNFYSDFIKETKVCPPCDKNSNECKSLNGKYLPCYLRRSYGKGKRLYFIC